MKEKTRGQGRSLPKSGVSPVPTGPLFPPKFTALRLTPHSPHLLMGLLPYFIDTNTPRSRQGYTSRLLSALEGIGRFF
jgi:hypothetical protein